MLGRQVSPSLGISIPRRTLAVLGLIVLSHPLFGAGLANAQVNSSATEEPVSAKMTAASIPGGARFSSAEEEIEVVFCEPGVVHVTASPMTAPTRSAPKTWTKPWIMKSCDPNREVKVDQTDKEAHVRSGQLDVAMDLDDGFLQFLDAKGVRLLGENHDGKPRRYRPAPVRGQQLYQVSERFLPDMQEGLYGLGQHQSGDFNYRGAVVELAQANSNIAVPFLVSTNGYGILWNTASRSTFDNRFERELKLTADAASGIDYYVFYGPEMDTIVHHYRELTGHAPLFGEWAYGFVQSKDRYTSAQQLLDIAGSYRTRHIPLDLIVQDWFWWQRQGDSPFSKVYLAPNPDVPGALRALHDEGVHAIISVWSVLDRGSDAYRAMKDENLLIPGTPDYDPTNSKARDFYWSHLIQPLFAQGWDGFWLDSSEPETWKGESDAVLADKDLSIGPGAVYTNIFPLMHTGNVYEHWRAATDQKRAFILTRSAFLGQQRNATVEWSGDIYATYPVLKRQIAAGLNFALSGMPYWTTDIAGYTNPYGDDANQNSSYQELYTRWFEFGTFSPILRTHGHRNANELYTYGAQSPTLIAYDRLRSRLLPYTYSLAWKVTHDDYTIMRPLVMDWRTDLKARDIGDQFLFGPAILVNPVTEANATGRSVYLPPAPRWYDFWTGETIAGSQQIVASAPLDKIPLYVRGGSIIPLGPEREYASQDLGAPVEICVYPGADASFDLYEDAGDSYDYEKGIYNIIPLRWSDAAKMLTVGARTGKYPKAPSERTFRIVLVRPGHGSSGAMTESADKVITYQGTPIAVNVP